MAIINQSRIILILIISCLLGLELFGRSKIDTQETSLNIALVSCLLTFDKSLPKYYLIGRIIYFSIMFFCHNYEILRDIRHLLEIGASFYYLRMLVTLTQYRGGVRTFNVRKSIFQQSRKTFSFIFFLKLSKYQ